MIPGYLPVYLSCCIYELCIFLYHVTAIGFFSLMLVFLYFLGVAMTLNRRVLHRVRSPLRSPRLNSSSLRKKTLLKRLSGDVQFGVDTKANLKVVVRVRPFNQREKENNAKWEQNEKHISSMIVINLYSTCIVKFLNIYYSVVSFYNEWDIVNINNSIGDYSRCHNQFVFNLNGSPDFLILPDFRCLESSRVTRTYNYRVFWKYYWPWEWYPQKRNPFFFSSKMQKNYFENSLRT